MKILLTGAFGNVGESTLLALFKKDYDIRCFDLKTERNEKIQKRLAKMEQFDTVWGDIRNQATVETIVEGIDCIIHLAAIIPPLSESKPDFARSVNIEGTKLLVKTAEKQEVKPKFVFASSVSLFGPTMHLQPPRTIQDPVNPTDTYTETKFECEKTIKSSSIQWTILRLAATPPIEMTTEIDPIVFEMPLDQRIEFVHSRDVGQAFANAIEAETIGKTLLIGGGPSSQMVQREFLTKLFDGMGIGMLPDSAFRVATKPEEYFYTDWLDTRESQQLLQYQSRSVEDYIKEMTSQLGMMRYLTRLFKGLARKRILDASPYYQTTKQVE
ncbi:MAG: NAD-dependent epimerase/dehydratase family protein [Candidatus Thorarchaeota archaeon]